MTLVYSLLCTLHPSIHTYIHTNIQPYSHSTAMCMRPEAAAPLRSSWEALQPDALGPSQVIFTRRSQQFRHHTRKQRAVSRLCQISDFGQLMLAALDAHLRLAGGSKPAEQRGMTIERLGTIASSWAFRGFLKAVNWPYNGT